MAVAPNPTLEALTSALGAQKVQMRPVPFAQESAELDTPLGSLEQLVNVYIEAAPPQARSKTILRTRPGLAQLYELALTPIRAMSDELPGYIYIAASSSLFRLTPDGVVNHVGPFGAPSLSYADMITMATGPNHTVLVSPPLAFGIRHGEDILHNIVGTVDGPFPGASSVAYIDGYFVFTAAGDTSQFFAAKLLNPDDFDSLDFAYADAIPNIVRRVISHQDRLWFCGEAGIEIWVDTGDTDFPFRRDNGGIIPFGVRNPRSVAVCDGSLFWFGQNGMILRTNGYRAERVSTHAIERKLHDYTAGMVNPDSAVETAFAHTEDGHPLYSLTLLRDGDPGLTLTYDTNTKYWHERSSAPDGRGRWLPSCSAYSTALGGTLLGDSNGGKLFTPMKGIATDNENSWGWRAVGPPIWNGTRRAFMDRIEVECELGGAGLILDYTDDAGATWKGARTLPLTGRRAVGTRLGSFYHRTLRLHGSGRATIYGADAQIRSAEA